MTQIQRDTNTQRQKDRETHEQEYTKIENEIELRWTETQSPKAQKTEKMYLYELRWSHMKYTERQIVAN